MSGNDVKEENREKGIRNRDIQKLSQVLYILQDVSTTEMKGQWISDRLQSITQWITGMPGGGGHGNSMADMLAELCEMREKYGKECREYLRELKDAEEILNSIRRRTLRTFVVMKYVFCMGNEEIMRQLNMKRRRFEQACRAIEQAPDMAHVQWVERFSLKE